MSEDSANLEQARGLAQQGRYAEALALFQKVFDGDPGNVDALFMIGACHYRVGASGQARSAWARVLELRPDHPKAAEYMGKLGPESIPGVSAASPSSPSGKAPARKRADSARSFSWGWIKWAGLGVAVIGVGVLAFDMVQNPESYPFLPKREAGSSGDLQVGSASPPQPIIEEGLQPLEPTLPGRWFFKWENDPATVSFNPDGSVRIDLQRSGATIPLQGRYRVDGTTIHMEDLTCPIPEVGIQGEAEDLYNAKIVYSRMTFNFGKPDGPSILAEKQ